MISLMQMAHDILQAHGNAQLHTLLTLVEENGVWSNATLCSLLSSDTVNVEKGTNAFYHHLFLYLNVLSLMGQPYLFQILVIMTFIYNCTVTIVNLSGCASSVVHEFLSREGPELLHMRIKHLIKQKCMDKAAILAKICAEFPEFGGKKNFKQIYLVCLCEIKPQQELMQEVRVFFKKKNQSIMY